MTSMNDCSDTTDQPSKPPLAYPTRLVPAAQLDNLTDLVSVEGDALADSEALYDPDFTRSHAEPDATGEATGGKCNGNL